MAEATRDRVRAAIKELGFVRNESARRLRQGPAAHPEPPAEPPPSRAPAYGVLVEDLANPYASDVARGAERALNKAGRDVLWLSSDHDPAKERRGLDLLAAQRTEGVLVIPVGMDDADVERLRAAGMSVVLLDHTRPGVCSARVDHVAGGAVAADRLLALGRRRIAFVSGRPEPLPVVARREGAASTLAGARAGTLPVFTMEALTPTEGQAAARRLLALPEVPDAVFCANDLLAIGLTNELVRLGVRIPDDIAVIGYDDIELAASAAVPLTTVRQPRRELGRAAAELALAETSEGAAHTHRQLILTPELVLRDSA